MNALNHCQPVLGQPHRQTIRIYNQPELRLRWAIRASNSWESRGRTLNDLLISKKKLKVFPMYTYTEPQTVISTGQHMRILVFIIFRIWCLHGTWETFHIPVYTIITVSRFLIDLDSSTSQPLILDIFWFPAAWTLLHVDRQKMYDKNLFHKGNWGKLCDKSRPSYLLQHILPPLCHNSWVPPFFHSASGLCFIVFLPHSCVTEQGAGAGGQEAGYWVQESTPNLARPGNTQWIQSQPSHGHLHGPVT